MKGNAKIIECLNKLLIEELTAMNQFIVHAEMAENWGYHKLHESTDKRVRDEMKHAEKLIRRILFLDGQPLVDTLNKITIGESVFEQIELDRELEKSAIKSYNEAIHLSAELSDNGTFELLESILLDEEKHIDLLEIQLDQIEQLDLKNFLMEQMA